MQYGLTLPNMYVDPSTLAELAYQAEMAGWGGVFVWDCLYVEPAPTYNPWVVLAAMAMRTERLRIGTLVTALARRQPWELARETVTLDHLSHGRLILSVGLGIPYDGAFAKVGRATDRRTRAQQLDEGLDILTGLWSGQPFQYQGAHYQVEEMTFLPPPMQRPRIPIWVVGAWPRKRSMQRVLRYDGVVATKINQDGSFAQLTPADIRAMKTFIDEQRSLTTPFDIVVEGETPGNDRVQAGTIVQPFAAAGATWWLEGVPTSAWEQGGLAGVSAHIQQGPPRMW